MNEEQRLAALVELEAAVSDAFMSITILNELVETDTCRVFEKTKDGNSYVTIIVSREEAERLSWMSGECLYRMRLLHEAYFHALDG